jgi:AAA+ ATPase superfamily predicted ATPase
LNIEFDETFRSPFINALFETFNPLTVINEVKTVVELTTIGLPFIRIFEAFNVLKVELPETTKLFLIKASLVINSPLADKF